MTTRSTRKPSSRTKANANIRSAGSRAKPLVVYTSQSVDGTSFGLDPESQERIRQTFPGVRVSTRHVYISHDTREDLKESIRRFDKQVISLLTGLSAERLAKEFVVSFRDPRSELEIEQLDAEPKVA